MTLTELVDSIRSQPGALSVAVGDDWLQGRSVFGGLQAVVAIQAMRSLQSIPVPLRCLQMSFIAPVPAGIVRADATLLRSGKSVTQIQARLLGAAGEVLALAVGTFGAVRESRVVHRPAATPATNDGGTEMPFVEGVIPSFMRHFSVKLLTGALPFSSSPSNAASYQLGLRDSGPVSEAHILAIADFVPPVALSWMALPTPGSSVTWMLELLTDRFEHLALQDWRVDTEMRFADAGYTSQSTRIVAPDGAVVALSQQSMVVFG